MRRRSSSHESNISPHQLSIRSPTRIAPPTPNCSESPTQLASRCRASNDRCADGRPRRTSEPSMTSSCTSALACSHSNDAAARTMPGSSGSPPAARQPQKQNAARSRLPPVTYACAASRNGESSGPRSESRTRWRSTKASSSACTSVVRSAMTSCWDMAPAYVRVLSCGRPGGRDGTRTSAICSNVSEITVILEL